MRPCILLSPVRELRTWRARCGSSTRPLLLLAHGVLSMHRFVGHVHGRCGWNVCLGLTTRTSFPIPWPCTHYPFSSHDPRPFPDEDAGPHSLLSSAGRRPRLVPPAHPLGRSFQTRTVPFQTRPIPPFNRVSSKGEKEESLLFVHVSSIAQPAPPQQPCLPPPPSPAAWHDAHTSPPPKGAVQR